MPPAASSGPRRSRVAANVLLALGGALAVAAAVVLGVGAHFVMCGISGCSGGGFGRSTDPTLTRTLIALAGLALALPLLGYAVWQRSARLALAAVATFTAGTLAVGLAVGSDWRGCPRNISDETCLAERGH